MSLFGKTLFTQHQVEPAKALVHLLFKANLLNPQEQLRAANRLAGDVALVQQGHIEGANISSLAGILTGYPEFAAHLKHTNVGFVQKTGVVVNNPTALLTTPRGKLSLVPATIDKI
jgi:hypothetical protein